MWIDLTNYVPSHLRNKLATRTTEALGASGSAGHSRGTGGVWDLSDHRVYQGTCEERKLRSLYPKPFGDPLGLEEILSEGMIKVVPIIKTQPGHPKDFTGNRMDEGHPFLNSTEENQLDEIEVQLKEYLDSRIELGSSQVTYADGFCNEVDVYSSEYLFEESIGMNNGLSNKYENTGMESVGPYPKFVKSPNMSHYEKKIGSLYPEPYGDPLGLQDLLQEDRKSGGGMRRLEKAKSDGRLAHLTGSTYSAIQHAPMSKKRAIGSNYSSSHSAQIQWKGKEMKPADCRLDENKKNSQWPRNRRPSKARKPTTGRVPKRKSPKT